jgi:hypothetical protein
MDAVDDCITAVITSPTINQRPEAERADAQPAPSAPRTADRSEGCKLSASLPMPCCRVDRSRSGIVEDAARKEDEAPRDPDRPGTEMAHEFAIERWDAAAVFLTTRVELPQMLDTGIT